METNTAQFEIGQWIYTDEYYAQILMVNENYVEKYSPAYFDRKKVSEYIGDSLVCKVLCDFNGKIKNKNRIIIASSNWSRTIKANEKKIIKEIKIKQPEEYRNYITYNEKSAIGESLSIYLSLSENEIEKAFDEINSISKELPKTFTFKEFVKIAKSLNFSLDFDKSLGYQPGWGETFSINFFSPLSTTVNKQKVYSRIWGDKK